MATSKKAKRPSRRKGLRREVHIGKSHADHFYDYDDLPREAQLAHDWAADSGHQFIRYKYPNGRYEFIPLENFQLVGGKSPAGKPADGFASDSYSSGLAIRLLGRRRGGSEFDYAVWRESY